MAKQSDQEYIAQIRETLLDLCGGNERSVDIWLNSPHPALEGETAQEVIDGGEAELIAELVEHIANGGHA